MKHQCRHCNEECQNDEERQKRAMLQRRHLSAYGLEVSEDRKYTEYR